MKKAAARSKILCVCVPAQRFRVESAAKQSLAGFTIFRVRIGPASWNYRQQYTGVFEFTIPRCEAVGVKLPASAISLASKIAYGEPTSLDIVPTPTNLANSAIDVLGLPDCAVRQPATSGQIKFVNVTKGTMYLRSGIESRMQHLQPDLHLHKPVVQRLRQHLPRCYLHWE